MSGIALPIDVDTATGLPAFPAADHRIAQDVLLTYVSGRPLGARSGVRPGGEPTVTVSGGQYTVTPFCAVADPGTGLTVGAYLVAFKANETAPYNPADGSNERIDRLDVIVPDDPPGGGSRVAFLVYTAGTPGQGAAPAAPSRSFPIGTIRVPKSGSGNPVFTATWPWTVASGGVLPVRTINDYPAGPYRGLTVDHPQLGLVRHNGTRWEPVGIPKMAAGNPPANPATGDYYDDATAGLQRYDGAKWVQQLGGADGGSSGYLKIGSILIQWGIKAVTANNASSGSATVVFPQPFAANVVPTVVATQQNATAYFAVLGGTPTATQAVLTISHRDAAAATNTLPVHWTAIGLAP